MDGVTLIALKESIEKWEKRAAGAHNLPLGTAACPLCRLFHADYQTDTASCEGCPVFEKTRGPFCIATPYLDYADNPTDANAKRELEFLKSLLPAEETRFGWVDLDYLS